MQFTAHRAGDIKKMGRHPQPDRMMLPMPEAGMRLFLRL
jgi:hypothetical protein